jgi:anti-anti-sigma regulatory factor
VGDVRQDVGEHDGVELAVDSIGGVLAVSVRGALVGGAGKPLGDCLSQAIRGGRPVVVDLTATTGIDQRGIDLLLEAHRSLATRLRLVIERRGDVHEALRRAGVAHVLALHGSRPEALSAARPR